MILQMVKIWGPFGYILGNLMTFYWDGLVYSIDIAKRCSDHISKVFLLDFYIENTQITK